MEPTQLLNKEKPKMLSPKWSRELVRFLPAKAQFVLWGNIHDVYPIQVQDSVTTLKMDMFLNTTLREQGYTLVVKYEPLAGFTLMPGGDAAKLKELTGLDCGEGKEAKATLPKAAEAIEKLVKAPGIHCAVLLNFASRIPDICSTAGGNDVNDFFYRMFRLMNEAAPRLVQPEAPAEEKDKGEQPAETEKVKPEEEEPKEEKKESLTALYSPLFWILDKENDLPSWYALNNARLRSLPIPKPDNDIRRYIVESIAPRIDGYEAASEEQRKENIQLFITQTSGLFASELIAIVQMSRREGLRFNDIGEAIRRYKLGIMENLWAKLDHDRVRNAEERLSRSVMGQDKAVRHVANTLKRSVYSLSGAQFSRYSQKPKGVLFFAGPTGVGKTEMAKAITELIFGSPTNYIRFDMSEFGHEHADQRLVGAPPGYVGYDVGGELTNAIKQNPFSVVLFDEVEKAHTKILDMFLQILDDGRLTSGRGETVYFSESLIVFTSNLGVSEQMPDGTKRHIVTPDMPYEEVERKILEATDNFFRYKINRPELLNRIGKNIVVFDFIRAKTAEKIFDKMLGNLLFRLKDSHGIEMTLSEQARKQLLDTICSDLSMGGRGVGNSIEELLVNPLSKALFENPVASGGSIEVKDISRDETGWRLTF